MPERTRRAPAGRSACAAQAGRPAENLLDPCHTHPLMSKAHPGEGWAASRPQLAARRRRPSGTGRAPVAEEKGAQNTDCYDAGKYRVSLNCISPHGTVLSLAVTVP